MSNVLHESVTASDAVPSAGEGLRILMVAPQPWFRPRGTPFSVLHRIRALTQAGHRVDLVTYPFGEDVPMPGLRIVRAGRPFFVRDVRIGPSIPKIFLDWYLYRATVKMLKDNTYDLLHTHEEAAFFGVGLARKHGLLHVYDMHSSLPQQLSNFKAYDLGLFRGIFRRLERKVLTTCDGVITICPDLAVVATADCGDTPHSMIENTGDDAKVFDGAGHDPRAELGLDDKRILLYTGTFEPYQGIDLLLDAFARIAADRPDAHLLLVGGRPAQVEEYRARAARTGLEARTTFVGQVHPSRIPGFLKAADLIVSPRTRGTNTPLKIYNYLRTRKPIVATDLHTHTQTLTPEISVLAPATAEGFAAGVARVLDEPALGERVAEAAARFMEGEFSDEAYLRKVTGFYQEVLRTAARRG